MLLNIICSEYLYRTIQMGRITILEFQYTRGSLKELTNNYRYILVLDIEHTCTEDGSIPPNEREIIEIGAALVCTQTFCILLLISNIML